MMQFEYVLPRAEIRALVGSYYDTTIPVGFDDVMRAEIANVRFIIRGAVRTNMNGKEETYPAGTALLCGPTYKWCSVGFDSDTLIFGAAITPLGWARMFGVPANTLSDRTVPLADHVPPECLQHIQPIFDAKDAPSRAAAADIFFAALDDPARRVHEDFLALATRWITDPEPNELEDLLAATDISARQVERLCKLYFGSAPKRLHRKFRALHSANRLTWQELTDWRDIATTAYFDQSHFIREFRHFNGRTPSEFIKGAHLLVRQTLKERLQIAHESPFSLVG
jgi:AraC-like DNA-binding protein